MTAQSFNKKNNRGVIIEVKQDVFFLGCLVKGKKTIKEGKDIKLPIFFI